MALMPAPMIAAEKDSCTRLISGLLATESANPEMAMAITREATVRPRSYVRGIGSENANIPMKCIDQIPQPIASAPPTTHMPRTAGRDCDAGRYCLVLGPIALAPRSRLIRSMV